MKKLVFTLICLLPVFTSQANIIIVDNNGPADFDNIQDAINASGEGDMVIVKPGTYNEGIFFSNKAITLMSENPDDPGVVESTIISSDSGYSVSFDFGEGNRSVITGFTITRGGIHCYDNTSPTISKNIIRDCGGYGIHGENNAEPIIADNTISSNAGQGIYHCNGPITNNVIENNVGGVAYCDGDITDNVIINNSDKFSAGSGGALSFCKGKISRNLIADNYASRKGGGCYECTGDITGNRIIGNTSEIAGGAMSNCRGKIMNNIIAGNRSANGGGLFSCYQIYNNTIVSNTAKENGGALSQCPGDLINNIIAFNSAATVGGVYGASISSYNVFWSNEAGNFGGGGTSGPGDIIAEPRIFSNGYRDDNDTPDESDDFWVDGDYHVTSKAGRWNHNDQSWIVDSIDSPCIDAGDPNSDWTAELWPHGKRINIGAFGGTVQASMSMSDAGNFANLNPDVNDANDWVDYNDMRLITNQWLSSVTDEPLVADLNRDGRVDFADYAILVNNWQPEPPVPQAPIPDPMAWDIEPHATSTTTIAMSALIAASTDDSGVEYYFDCNTPGGHDSGWRDDPAYTDTGLIAEQEYQYRVKARNKANLIETSYSGWRYARTSPDIEPPSPDPATWATEPYAISPASIKMEATIASDDSGVEYYFECTSNPTYSSGWQDSTVYEIVAPSDLPKELYTFVVRVRDKSPNRNTTGASTEVTVDLEPPAPDPATWQTAPYAIPPSSVRMVAKAASDSSGAEYYFECTSNPDYSGQWQDSRAYRRDNLPNGYHSFVVRIRDKSPSRNTTGNSNEVTVDLQPPTPDPMRWESEPAQVYQGGGTFDYWAEMTAAEATDPGGDVQYYFECTTESGFSSGWRSSRTYNVKIGRRGQGQRFRVKARDIYGNETAFSSLLPAN